MSNDKTYLEIAKAVSQLSNDPNTQVGAVLVMSDGEVTVGCNSFPRGVKETRARWQRPTKYDYVVTAEVNAILAAQGKDLAGSTLFITQSPCLAASKVAVQAGVARIVSPKQARLKAAAHSHDSASNSHSAASGMLKEAGVRSVTI